MDHYFYNIVFPLDTLTTTTSTDATDASRVCEKENLNLANQLCAIKSQITSLETKEWDYLKKKNNPFECVTTNGGLANYTPISRAYFKMTEILHLFRDTVKELIDNPNYFTTLHLAEGPGGFMECLNNTLQDLHIPSSQYDMYGMTLIKEENKSVPSWKKAKFFLQNHPHMHILTGADGTGDLYNIDNIFTTAVEMATTQKASIITGDGGFDFSTDFNQQESMSFPLLYCQALTALLCQKPGGMFILKFFDTYQSKTLQLLCLLRQCYTKLYFVKPYTSRPANSEKYLVCVGFRNNITVEEIRVFLLDIPKIGSPGHHAHLEINKYNTADETFYRSIHHANATVFERQKKFILETLALQSTLDEHKDRLYQQQVRVSAEWCRRYNIRINYQSRYTF